MCEEKYGVFALPENIRTFASFEDAKLKMRDWFSSAGRKIIEHLYDYRELYLYAFPDGSFCTLSVDKYDESAPKWIYYKNIKDLDGYASANLWKHNIVNNTEELLKEVNPYGYEFAKKENVCPVTMLFFPKLEQLKKAGYLIADTIIEKFNATFSDKDRFCTLKNLDVKSIAMIFHKGTSLYDIINFNRDLAKEMKDVTEISLWNSCRKLAKKGLLDVESIRFLKEANYSEKDIQSIYSIVTKGMDGICYFTIPSLIKYLRKVDMYEAIGVTEALMLISDYIRCCHALEVKPRFDSDSLKREHDVMARNARTVIQKEQRERMNRQMKPACDELHELDYKEDVFFVRGIDSYEDLVDEATQQSNCLAGYAYSIAKRVSKIYVMRETAHPDKSLITIELSPNNTIRQKYLSHNRPIHSKAHSDFIDRWIKHIRTKAS